MRAEPATLIPIAPTAHPARDDRWQDALVLTIAVTISLVVVGYQFGRGNLTVYLLDAVRQQHSDLLVRDWFTHDTLQYHQAFTYLTSGLNRIGMLEPGFLAGYLVLMVLWQLGWLRWTTALGLSRQTYLVSVLLYFLSAGGISVGVYQFLQDSCFLPSNVSNIAMLWGGYFLVRRKDIAAAACLGISGFFHLNYAAIALPLGALVFLWRWKLDREPVLTKKMLVSVLLVGVPSMINIAMALKMKFEHSGQLPMDEFVRIYVKFRHTHHFDPLAWPIGLWISFLWPIPVAVWGYLRAPKTAALRETGRLFVFFLTLQLIAFLFAGVWFVSESLVQMILWRFSIYVKMLSCIGAAWVICDPQLLKPPARRTLLAALPIGLAAVCIFLLTISPGDGMRALVVRSAQEHRITMILLTALCAAPLLYEFRGRFSKSGILTGITAMVVVLIIGWNRWIGIGMAPPPIETDYLQVCDWARTSTPIDAIFLVPPGETAFRLYAQRAIIINFKHVPQLGGELPVWLTRLRDVLGISDLEELPRGYNEVMDAMDNRYESRPPRDLNATAEKYQARYIVVNHSLDPAWSGAIAFQTSDGRYFVYDREKIPQGL